MNLDAGIKGLLNEAETDPSQGRRLEEPVPAHLLCQREFVLRKEVPWRERDEGKGVRKAGRGAEGRLGHQGWRGEEAEPGGECFSSQVSGII